MTTQENVVLVEGKDDLNVVAHLLRRHLNIEDVKQRLNIQDKQSVDKLLRDLRNDLQRSELKRLGIIVDADTDIEARWAAIRDRLLNLADIEINVPEKLTAEGLVFDAKRQDRVVKVGVWVMPDNQLPGILEDFIAFLVPPGDKLWPRMKQCIADIPQAERRFIPERQSKAEIHTWLAWQEEPGNRWAWRSAPAMWTLISLKPNGLSGGFKVCLNFRVVSFRILSGSNFR